MNIVGIEARQKKQRDEELRELSQTYGNIPDVPIFERWDTRKECSQSGVHRPIRAGIRGSSNKGAYSVALSDGYIDDEDWGDVIIYTGEGGQGDINSQKQTEDQSWDKYPNTTLIASFRTGNPVRVIRSWKCRSKYAPSEGCRYDGLYKVTAYWTDKGRSGKKICRCRLERLPNQLPIPTRQENTSSLDPLPTL